MAAHISRLAMLQWSDRAERAEMEITLASRKYCQAAEADAAVDAGEWSEKAHDEAFETAYDAILRKHGLTEDQYNAWINR